MAESDLPGDWTEQYAGSKLNLSSFKLSFSDEFDTLDVVPNNGSGKWFAPVHAPFGAAKFMPPDGATNPFSVSDGQLTIRMEQVEGAWQSGTMQTVNNVGLGFAQEYGYFEMRAAFHGGQGAWPAFWLLPQDTTVARPEVDIVEAYSGDPDGHHQAVHLRDRGNHAWDSNYSGLAGSMYDGSFHTYGAMITEDWIVVFYDGQELSRFPMSDFFRTPLYMVVTLAMDPSGVGQASGAYDMVLDYVRAYAAPDVMEQHLDGTDAADILTGGTFDDILDGCAGADTMSGGLGNDTYHVDNPLDVVVEADGAGIDLIFSSATYSLSGQYLEQLTLTESANINATGNELDNTLVGNGGDNLLSGEGGDDVLRGGAGADLLDGGVGVDVMEGGAGNDTYYVDNGFDSVVERDAAGNDQVFSSISYQLSRDVEKLSLTGVADIKGWGNSSDNELTGNDGSNILYGYAGNDTIQGGAGSDVLVGNDGSDVLDGGTGADRMDGGAGNDTFYVDHLLDDVKDESGLDQIFSSVSYSVSDRLVENLMLIGGANINATGDSLGNALVGNAGNNVLFGSAGNDTLEGGEGDDRLDGGTGVDTVSYANSTAGVTISLALTSAQPTGVGGVDILANIENLIGSAYADVLTGDRTANRLEGGAGNDRLDGAAGTDTAVFTGALSEYDIQTLDAVALLFSVTARSGSNGTDILTNVEYLQFSDQTLAIANVARNFANTMIGGAGNDTCYVDHAQDVVIEADDGGFDQVFSSVSFSLAGQFVEKLVLTGTSGLSGTGNGLNNVLTGNAGANLLDGGAGADSMAGGDGNDTYFADNTGDRVVEYAAAGVDTVRSAVSRGLEANVERLTLVNVGSALTGTGNSLANIIIGNSFANTLTGGLGNDTLSGGNGNDRLIGGVGNDRLIGGANNDGFVFNTAPNASTNRDVITDFSHVHDTVLLENAIFTRLGAGVMHGLNAAFFRAGAAALDANDYIVYNKVTGNLFYDMNGSGAGGATLFATLLNKPVLAANDFVVI